MDGANSATMALIAIISQKNGKNVFLSVVKVGGMCNVAVKCLDITQNTDCVGSLLDRH